MQESQLHILHYIFIALIKCVCRKMEKSKEADNISESSENMSASASASASENMPDADIYIKEEQLEASYIESDPEYEQGQKFL